MADCMCTWSVARRVPHDRALLPARAMRQQEEGLRELADSVRSTRKTAGGGTATVGLRPAAASKRPAMVLASRDTGSKSRALSIGLSLCLLATAAGRAAAQHSCPPGNTGQLCAACKPGWSRIDGPDGALTQGDCERCPDPTNCLGGEPSACAVGSEGQLCAVCSAGWSRIDGLAPDEPCKECGVGNWLALLVGTAGVFVLAPAAVFLASALDVASPRDLRIQVFGKLSFLYGAVMVNLGDVFDVEWPAPFSWLMTVAHMLWRVAAFDFVPFLVGGCVEGATYVTEMIGSVCSVVVWLVMIIAFAAANPFKQEDVKLRGLKMLWIVMFANYVSLSKNIVGAFACKRHGPGCRLHESDPNDPPAPGDRPGNETGQSSTRCISVLTADYQVDCESEHYSSLLVMALLLLLIVVCGVPIVLVATVRIQTCNGALARSPEKFFGVTAERKGDPLFDRYEFLQAGYKSVYLLWGVWELMFALWLSGSLIFFKAGSAAQVRFDQTWVYLPDFPLTDWCPFLVPRQRRSRLACSTPCLPL
eukprot:COSAG06_NODE_3667_length_5042_cov_2.098321_5_plen_533_part_00